MVSFKAAAICDLLSKETRELILKRPTPSESLIVAVAGTRVRVFTDEEALRADLRREYPLAELCPQSDLSGEDWILITRYPTEVSDFAICTSGRLLLVKRDGHLFFGSYDLRSIRMIAGSFSDAAQGLEDLRSDPLLLMMVELEVLRLAAERSGGMAVFHGSTVAAGDAAFAFAGPSSSGKTTLALAMTAGRFRLISDDHSCLHFDTRTVAGYARAAHVRQGGRRLLDVLGADHSPASRLPKPGGAPARLHSVFLLDGFAAEPRLRPLRPAEALPGLMSQIMLHSEPHPAGLAFRLASALPSCNFYSLTAGDLARTVALLDSLAPAS